MKRKACRSTMTATVLTNKCIRYIKTHITQTTNFTNSNKSNIF